MKLKMQYKSIIEEKFNACNLSSDIIRAWSQQWASWIPLDTINLTLKLYKAQNINPKKNEAECCDSFPQSESIK